MYNLKCLDVVKCSKTGHFLTTHLNIYTKERKFNCTKLHTLKSAKVKTEK
jgi:hypothetical protein